MNCLRAKAKSVSKMVKMNLEDDTLVYSYFIKKRKKNPWSMISSFLSNKDSTQDTPLFFLIPLIYWDLNAVERMLCVWWITLKYLECGLESSPSLLVHTNSLLSHICTSPLHLLLSPYCTQTALWSGQKSTAVWNYQRQWESPRSMPHNSASFQQYLIFNGPLQFGWETLEREMNYILSSSNHRQNNLAPQEPYCTCLH